MRFIRFFFVSLLSVLVLWLAGYAVFVVSVLSLHPQQPEQKTDAIIVLTGGDHRVQTGFNLFASGLAPQLFISGVHDGTSLEKIIARWPGLPNGKRSLPACCMDIGHAATNTVENAVETREWVEEHAIKTARIVTSAYHMPRAMLEFRSYMPELQIYKNPVTLDPLSPKDEFFWHITFSEYHKLVYRYILLTLHGT